MSGEAARAGKSLYRTVWRWHFYAGLFVLPFVLILSVTGAVYLFKPQTDRWQERAFHTSSVGQPVSPDRQLAAALAANPGGSFNHYRLPKQAGDAAMIQLGMATGAVREVFVSPQGKVIGSIDPDTRISETVSRIHGTLLLGEWGDWLVELAASWTFVMILSGLYLWWPRPFAAAGTLWPRLSLRGRPLLRDLHRVTGFWVAGLVLIMLASGLPWASAWGALFERARAELGLIEGPRNWQVESAASHHDHGKLRAAPTAGPAKANLPLSAFVERARAERLPFPAIVLPPHAPQRFAAPTGDEWTVKSETQNRPLQRQVTFDPVTGAEIGRTAFADKHPVDRVVNVGIAWHEGQLFGLANQLIGLLTAIALIAVSLLGIMTWLKRRPARELAAPPGGEGALPRALIVAIVAGALLLPLFGASLLLVLLIDRLVALQLLARA